MAWLHIPHMLQLAIVLTCMQTNIEYAKGELLPPNSGDIMYVTKPSTVNLTWGLNFGNNSQFGDRKWFFTKLGENQQLLAEVFSGKLDIKKNVLPSFNINLPTTLILDNVDLNYNGTYSFTIAVKDSSVNYEVGTQVVIIDQPIAVISGCLLTNYVNETKNISCLCTSSGGNPPPSVVWLKNDKAITSEGFLHQNLTITNASKNDTGNYTCKATSHTLSDEKDITILVKWKPKITVQCNGSTITHSSITVNKNEEISCNCESEDGIPKPKVFWLRKDDRYDVSSRRDLSNTLKQTMTKRNKGVYICRAETSYPDTTVWFTEYELEILVNYAPEITSFKADDNLPAYINTTVNLTCKADTFPLANFTLTRNGTVLHKTIETSNLTYVINQIGSSNIGEYLCVAKNPFGSQNKSLNVTMTDVKPTTLPTTVTDADTTLSSTPTEGTTTTPTKMSTGAIVGIAVGSVFAVALFFAILWLLCCKKGKEKQSETIVNPSAAVYKPSMMENPYESPDHMMGDGNTADGQDSAGSSRPSTTGTNPAPQAGGLPPVYAVVDKSRVTHNKKPEVDPSQVTYASLDAVALQPDSSRMHERPQVESNYASIDLRKL